MNPQPESSSNRLDALRALSARALSLDGAKAPIAHSAGPSHTFREVVLDDPSETTNPAVITWVNIYPQMQAIVIGEAQMRYRGHYQVHEGFIAKRIKEGCTDSPQVDFASCWLYGGKEGNSETLGIRIVPPKKDSSYEEMLECAANTEDAIRLAEARAKERGGRVVLEADSEPQQMVARILGRLHQVSNINTTDVKLINDAIIGEKLSTDIRHIYDKNTGTRYFFVEDLEALGKRFHFVPKDYPNDSLDSALTKHRDTICATMAQLVYFLTNYSLSGNREGQLFVVDSINGQRVTSAEALGHYVSDIVDLHDSVHKSQDWRNAERHIIDSLTYVIDDIKKNCDPNFYAINTQSPRFVELLTQVLRSESQDVISERRFSTPLIPLEFGYFSKLEGGDTEFIVTTKDAKLRDIADWLFGAEADKFLAKNRYLLRISDADYICVYKPKTTLTFEPHPPDFIRKLGDLPGESFVVEFGKFNAPPSRLILKENEYAPIKWRERPTETVRSLLTEKAPLELSEFVRNFKAHQHSLFKAVLEGIPGAKVKLAAQDEWVSVYGDSAPAAEREKKTCNYCAKVWVDGPRSDLMNFRELNLSAQSAVIEMDAAISAAGIIAQLPHLQRRDLIIHSDLTAGALIPTAGVLIGGTFLSAAESFCHSSEDDMQDYLSRVVPTLYGNFIARRLAPLGYSSDVKDSTSLREIQEQLIGVYTDRIRKALQDLSTSVSDGGVGSKELVLQQIRESWNTHSAEPEWWRPDIFKPTTFLPSTLALLNLTHSQIDVLCHSISETARMEIDLIKRIAPITESGVTVDELSQVERCADAVSSLIGAHLLKSDYLNKALDGLQSLADANLLTILERTWYITALDVNTRIAELHEDKSALPILQGIFQKARNGREFYDLLSSSPLHMGLSYETISACYDAVNGLRSVYRDYSTSPNKLVQLGHILRDLQPLGKLITD